MDYVWLIIIAFAALILVVFFVLRSINSRLDGGKLNPFVNKDTAPATPPNLPVILQKQPGQRCNDDDICDPESFILHDVVTKKPISAKAKQLAVYTTNTVSTTEHPFLINRRGIYMDRSNNWILSETTCSTSKFCGGRFYLCNGVWYFITQNDVAINMGDGYLVDGDKNSDKILKLFIYNGILYALAGDYIYAGFSQNLFRHAYLSISLTTHSCVSSPRGARSRWVWDRVKNISGKDISSSTIYDVDVGLGTNPALFSRDWKDPKPEECIAISTNEGECYIYKHGNWRTVVIDPYNVGVVGAATVSVNRQIPNRIRLGYNNQELYFYGRAVCFMKYMSGVYKELYRIDGVHDAIIDPMSRIDGIWTLSRDLKLIYYSNKDGICRRRAYDIDGILLGRAANECYIVNSGHTFML